MATNTATNTATSSKTNKKGRGVRKTAKDKKKLGYGGFGRKTKGSGSRKTSDDIEKDRNTGLGRTATARKKKEEEQDVEDLMREVVPKKLPPAPCGECGKQCKSEQGLERHRKVSVSLENKN